VGLSTRGYAECVFLTLWGFGSSRRFLDRRVGSLGLFALAF
jgi:hypothetical protein